MINVTNIITRGVYMCIYIYTHPNLLGVIALVIAISNLNCTPKELQEEIEAKDQDIEKGENIVTGTCFVTRWS